MKKEVLSISKKNLPDGLVNDAIRFKEVLVIGPNGESFGVMSRNDALNKAYDYDLDLVRVSPWRYT